MAKKVNMSMELRRLTPFTQYIAVLEAWEAHADAIGRMESVVEKMAKLCETDAMVRHPLALHYFLGGCDWHISEWDRKDTLFGYVILNFDVEMSEWGYINLPELLQLEKSFPGSLNLDYYCSHKTVEGALYHKDPEYFRRYGPDHLGG
jgi:hypothetical protein